jgi:TonB family protein
MRRYRNPSQDPEYLFPRGARRARRDDATGFTISLVGHAFVAFLALVGLFAGPGLEEVPIYSVTIEGGKSLGGRMQVAKDDTKQPLAPPKNVVDPNKGKPTAAPSIPEEKRPEEKNEPVPTAPPVKEEPKAEESVPLPTAAPTAVPTQAPTARPTSAPTPKPQPTAAPTAQPKREDGKKAKEKGEKKGEPDKFSKRDADEYQKSMQRYTGASSDAGGTGFGAARLGGNDMGGGIVKPREFFIYMQLLKDRVKEGWRWFDTSSPLIAQVEISISADGRITSQRIVRSSGNPEYDNSVIRAVRQADPLPPPPSSVYDDFKLVTILFDPRE